MSADVIILHAGDRRWRDRPIVDPFAASVPAPPLPPTAPLVQSLMEAAVSSLSGGDEGGRSPDQIAKRDQGRGGGRVVDGEAANVAGYIKQFRRKLDGVGERVRRGVCVIRGFRFDHRGRLLDIQDAARMGGNDFEGETNKRGVFA